MLIQAENFDDLLHEALTCLHRHGSVVTASRGKFVELVGVLLKLENPRARLSRSESKGRPFSCIGELLWYLSGRADAAYMEYFIPDYADDAEADGTLHGAYGPRLFPVGRQNQIETVINLLKNNTSTRRAVIQLFSSEDIESPIRYKEIPCTNTIQFIVRNELLECLVSMRSNDVFKGFPHDVFCFTMLQEMIAREIGIECGTYHHFAGSFHLYESDVSKSEEYIREGFHTPIAMPPMPLENPFKFIGQILESADKIRLGNAIPSIDTSLPAYWKDILRLLLAYHHSEQVPFLDELQDAMSVNTYFPFIERRKTIARPKGK